MLIDGLIVTALYIAGLYVLIAVHELGHYFVAKLFGFKVHAVEIGFGKKFFQKTIGETKFSLGYFFIGGRTMLDEAVSRSSVFEQFLITITGPLISIAFGIFALAFVFHGQVWFLLNPMYYLHVKLPYEIALSMAPAVKVVVLNGILVIKQSSMVGISLIYLGISSIIIGFFNLLPIPPLDGGKIAFTFLTKGMSDVRKEIIYNKAVNIGFVLVILLNILYSF